MVAVALLSAGRLAARIWSRPAADADIDVAHILMGVAMAGTLAGGPRQVPGGVWVAVFSAVTAWFAWRVVRETRGSSGLGARLAGHHVPHLIHGAAMIYMFAALRPVGDSSSGIAIDGMSGGLGSTMGTLSVPAVGLAFVVVMAGWAVFDLDRISTSRRGSGAPAEAPSAPTTELALATATPAGATPVGVDPAGVTPVGATPARANRSGAEPASAGPAVATTPLRGILDPRIATAGRVAMGVTMALMLVLMI